MACCGFLLQAGYLSRVFNRKRKGNQEARGFNVLFAFGSGLKGKS